MARKSKQKKRNKPNPPLSFLDKCIYVFGIIFSIALLLLMILGMTIIPKAFSFRDPSVLAYSSHNSNIASLPLIIYVVSSAVIFFESAMSERKPIFGNHKIRYGEDPWPRDCYPLFDPRKKLVYERPSHKERRHTGRKIWVIGLIACMLLTPLGLFKRACLMENYSIKRYNTLNIEAKCYTPYDYAELTISSTAPHYDAARKRWKRSWGYCITIEMQDGKHFTFSNYEFASAHSQQADSLSAMLDIKAEFPADRIAVEGAHNVESISSYLHMDESQTEMLKELFSN